MAGVVCSCTSSDKSYVSSTAATGEEARPESLFKPSLVLISRKYRALVHPCAIPRLLRAIRVVRMSAVLESLQLLLHLGRMSRPDQEAQAQEFGVGRKHPNCHMLRKCISASAPRKQTVSRKRSTFSKAGTGRLFDWFAQDCVGSFRSQKGFASLRFVSFSGLCRWLSVTVWVHTSGFGARISKR